MILDESSAWRAGRWIKETANIIARGMAARKVVDCIGFSLKIKIIEDVRGRCHPNVYGAISAQTLVIFVSGFRFWDSTAQERSTKRASLNGSYKARARTSGTKIDDE